MIFNLKKLLKRRFGAFGGSNGVLYGKQVNTPSRAKKTGFKANGNHVSKKKRVLAVEIGETLKNSNFLDL